MDENEFGTWYRSEHRRLVNALAVAAGDIEVARDVADEAFARCLERWDGPNRPADPSAWTYRVAVNLLRRRWRLRRREHELAVRNGPPQIVDLPQPAFELWQAVGNLPARMRLAVVLRYVGGLTEPEVAQAMGTAVGTVSATLSKARSTLAANLPDPRLPDPREVSDV